MSDFLNENVVRSMLKHLDAATGDTVTAPRAIFRAMGFELLRLWGQEDRNILDKAYFIQMLTMEYAVAHMLDLFHGIEDESLSRMSGADVVRYAVENLQDLSKDVTLPYEGQS